MSERLTGYDEVVAITQNTINSQLGKLCPADNSGAIQCQWSVRLNPTAEPDTPQYWPYLGVDAMEPPTVSLVLPDGATNSNEVQMTLHITSGKVQYFDLYGQQQTENMEGWTISFVTEMSLITIDSVDDVAAPQGTADTLNRYFQSSDFTVSAMACNFENANFASAAITVGGDGGSPIGPDDPSWSQLMLTVSSLLTQYFRNLQGSANPYIFGYPVQSTNPPETLPSLPAFAPTRAKFSTTPYIYPSADEQATGEQDGLSTLNFLLMTEDSPFPTSATAGIFDQNWVDSEQIQGTMAIAHPLFMSGFVDALLLPAVKSALGVNASWSTNGYTWTIQQTDYPYAGEHDGKGHVIGTDSGILNVYEELQKETYCQLTMSTGPAVTFSGSGYFYQRADVYEYPIDIKTHMAWTYVKMYWTLDIALSAGTNGKILADITVTQGNTEQDDWQNPLTKISDFLTGWFADTYSGLNADLTSKFESLESSNFDNLDSKLQQSFDALSSQIILPAGNVFYYKDLSFDGEQNLVLHVSYQD